MMNMIGDEATHLGKPRAHHVNGGFCARLLFEDGTASVAKLQADGGPNFGFVHDFEVLKSFSEKNAEGIPVGAVHSRKYRVFRYAFEMAKINPVWEGGAETVRTRSAKHWKK